jgi:hypothetical protein
MMTNNAFIFGDSYSTFRGYIPEGYAVYYHEAEGQDNTDVRKVSETWWHQVVTEADLNLIQNNSWSGSTICHTGYDGVDCSQTNSFIYRLRKLTREGFFEENDIHNVFVFGGTNDSWSNAPLGESMLSGWKREDLFSVLPAISYLTARIKNDLPNVKVIFILNSELKEEINEEIKKSAEYFGAELVILGNIDKSNGHPTKLGMKEIHDQIYAYLNERGIL